MGKIVISSLMRNGKRKWKVYTDSFAPEFSSYEEALAFTRTILKGRRTEKEHS